MNCSAGAWDQSFALHTLAGEKRRETAAERDPTHKVWVIGTGQHGQVVRRRRRVPQILQVVAVAANNRDPRAIRRVESSGADDRVVLAGRPVLALNPRCSNSLDGRRDEVDMVFAKRLEVTRSGGEPPAADSKARDERLGNVRLFRQLLLHCQSMRRVNKRL